MEFQSFLQDSLLQIISGYLFMSVFNFVSLRQNTSNTEYLLISSYTSGFIITEIFKLIPLQLENYFISVLICIFSIVLGYILGQIYISGALGRILIALKIRQSLQTNTWADIMDKDKPMKMKIYLKDGSNYYGYVDYISSDKDPLIALAAYEKYNQNNELIDDKLRENALILIHTSDMQYAEVFYHKDSQKIHRIRCFTTVVEKSRKKKNMPNN